MPKNAAMEKKEMWMWMASKTSRLCVAVVASVTALSLPARAAVVIEGVAFPPTFQAGSNELDLNCVGLLRYRYVFKGYVAGLYLDNESDRQDVMADVPKRLEISYFWSIDATAIADAGEKILADNVAAEALAGLRERLDRLRALYVDVKPGDRYALTYVPGIGTELTLNGKKLGTIEGADFAAAYFSIWFGDKPLDAALKTQLLTCA